MPWLGSLRRPGVTGYDARVQDVQCCLRKERVSLGSPLLLDKAPSDCQDRVYLQDKVVFPFAPKVWGI